MARPTIKEISEAGLTDEQWSAAERRVRRRQVRREAMHLRRTGRIRPAKAMLPTPLVPASDGHIQCIGGQCYTVGFTSTYNK